MTNALYMFTILIQERTWCCEDLAWGHQFYYADLFKKVQETTLVTNARVGMRPALLSMLHDL